MLRNASAIHGCTIAARDGSLGTVSDFLFDDATWMVRWLVVDTGHWLPGRKVLLPASILGEVDGVARKFLVDLTMQQVRDSPDIDSERTVSRQMETSVYDYYGWNPYWGSGLYMGSYGFLGDDGYLNPAGGTLSSQEAQRRADDILPAHREDEDPHLRSIEEVSGYYIHATDGEVGHVEDFLLEDSDWSIRYLVVATKNWWPGRKVIISPLLAHDINWSDRLVNLNVDRENVKGSPDYDAATVVDQAYEAHLHRHYSDVKPAA